MKGVMLMHVCMADVPAKGETTSHRLGVFVNELKRLLGDKQADRFEQHVRKQRLSEEQLTREQLVLLARTILVDEAGKPDPLDDAPVSSEPIHVPFAALYAGDDVSSEIR